MTRRRNGNIPGLVDKLDRFVADHDLDGVDLDIEDPGNRISARVGYAAVG